MAFTPTPDYVIGKVIAVSFKGKDMYVTKSDMTRSVNVVKVTNAKSGGFQEVKGGIRSASGSCEVVYNGDDAIDITEGDEGEMIYKPAGMPLRSFPVLISNVKEAGVIDGDFTYSFDWVSSGNFAPQPPAP